MAYNTYRQLVFNVLDLGADPTGTTDNWYAVQTALNNLSSGSLTTIYFPKGIYKFSNHLYCPNTSTTVTLKGDSDSIGPNLDTLFGTPNLSVAANPSYFAGSVLWFYNNTDGIRTLNGVLHCTLENLTCVGSTGLDTNSAHGTFVTAAFVQPAIGSNVSVTFNDTSLLTSKIGVNNNFTMSMGGIYKLISVTNSTTAVIQNVGGTYNMPVGMTVIIGGYSSTNGLGCCINQTHGYWAYGEYPVLVRNCHFSNFYIGFDPGATEISDYYDITCVGNVYGISVNSFNEYSAGPTALRFFGSYCQCNAVNYYIGFGDPSFFGFTSQGAQYAGIFIQSTTGQQMYGVNINNGHTENDGSGYGVDGAHQPILIDVNGGAITACSISDLAVASGPAFNFITNTGPNYFQCDLNNVKSFGLQTTLPNWWNFSTFQGSEVTPCPTRANDGNVFFGCENYGTINAGTLNLYSSNPNGLQSRIITEVGPFAPVIQYGDDTPTNIFELGHRCLNNDPGTTNVSEWVNARQGYTGTPSRNFRGSGPSLNSICLPMVDNGHAYKCTTTGVCGATEPIWNTGSGSTTTDGTVVWTEIGAAALWLPVQPSISIATIPIATGTFLLSVSEYQSATINFTGTLTGSVVATFPAIPGSTWTIDTTGVTFSSQTIKLATSAGTWGTTISTPGVCRVTCASNGKLYGQTLTS